MIHAHFAARTVETQASPDRHCCQGRPRADGAIFKAFQGKVLRPRERAPQRKPCRAAWAAAFQRPCRARPLQTRGRGLIRQGQGKRRLLPAKPCATHHIAALPEVFSQRPVLPQHAYGGVQSCIDRCRGLAYFYNLSLLHSPALRRCTRLARKERHFLPRAPLWTQGDLSADASQSAPESA